MSLHEIPGGKREEKLTVTNVGSIKMLDGKIHATNNPIEPQIAVIAEIDSSGRFSRIRRYYDSAIMMRQPGLIR